MDREVWGDDRRELWHLYTRVNVQLMELLDQQLQQHHDLTLVDYGILSRLMGADERRLRMSELANEVLVSRSRLTYRIDRMVETGVVVREGCEDDRRGMWAVITEPGTEAFEQARISHESAVDGWFFDQLSPEELDACQQVLSRISNKLSRGSKQG